MDVNPTWTQADDVNHPAHYNKNSMETIDLIKQSMDKDELHGYLKGNIIKYISRHKHKDPSEPQKDLLKAKWYLEKLVLTMREDDV